MVTEPQPAGVPRSPWMIVLCAWLLAFGMFTPIFCIPPIEHIIVEELTLSHAEAGLLFSTPIIILAVFAVPSGFLGDRLGIRKAGGIGASVLAAGGLLKSFSTDSGTLFAATVLFGVGLTLVYPNLPKLIGTWFPREKVGLVTGIYTTGMVIAATLPIAITLPLVFPVTDSFQGVFFIWSLPAVAAAISWWITVREPATASSQVQQVVEGRKSSYPVLKDRNLWLVAVMIFADCFHLYIWAGWVPALMMLKGAPPDLAAIIASVRGWVGIPMIFLVPWAAYKVGLRKPFLWGAPIVMVFASLAAIYVNIPWSWLLMVVVGVPVSGAFSMLLALPVELVPKESVGAASGMVLSVGYLGGFAGPWLAGYILDATGTLNLALVALIGVAIAWAAFAFVIPETGPKARR